MFKRFFEKKERKKEKLQKFKKLLLENRKKFRDVKIGQEDKYEYETYLVWFFRDGRRTLSNSTDNKPRIRLP